MQDTFEVWVNKHTLARRVKLGAARGQSEFYGARDATTATATLLPDSEEHRARQLCAHETVPSQAQQTPASLSR